MKNILNVLVIALFVTIIHGFPEQGQSTPSSKTDNESDKTKDTLTQTKPLDRSQISTLPATVDFKKQDTIPQNKDDNVKTVSATADSYSKQGSIPQNTGDSRNTRDTSKVDSTKKQDQFPRGTSPSTLDSYKIQNDESHSRKARGAESSKQRNPSDVESNHHHQQPQTRPIGKDNKPPHLTKDVPVHSNEHHPGVQAHNPRH